MSFFSKTIKIFGKISWTYFFVSAFVGLLFIFLLGPQEKKVLVYPNDNIINKPIFQDNSNTCYKMTDTKVQCPFDKSKIETFTIQ